MRILSLSRLRRQLPRQREPRGLRFALRGVPSAGAKPRGGRRSGLRPPTSCLPLTREVASPKGLTEGEIGRAYGEAGCAEEAGCKFSPSVACGDSSLVRGSQGGWAMPCGQAPQREPSPPRDGGRRKNKSRTHQQKRPLSRSLRCAVFALRGLIFRLCFRPEDPGSG